MIDMDDLAGVRWHGRPSDVATIVELLKKHGDGTPNFHVTLKSSAIETLTRSALEEAIFELFYESKSLALLYLAGHGASHAVPLPLDQVLKSAARSKAPDKIILADPCGPGGNWTVDRIAGRVGSLPEGVSVMAAGQPAYPDAGSQGSRVFSAVVALALKGGACNLRGEITPGGVFAFVDQALGAGDHRPVYKTNVARFTSIRTVKAPDFTPIVSKLTEYFPSPQSSHKLDPSYVSTNTEREMGVRRQQPEADPAHVAIMQDLHTLVILGLVVPVGEEHMYLAAMNSKSCRLTALGLHYWSLVKDKLHTV